MAVTFRALSLAEAEAAHAIEVASYAPGKAATLTQIRDRIHDAGDYFLGVYDATTLVGFVNGTLSAQQELTEDSMAQHHPRGRYLCIHSLVVAASHRRQGLATKLLSTYVRRLVDKTHVATIALLAEPLHVAFYVKCGFAVVRMSPVAYNQATDFELVFDCIAARQIDVVVVDAFAKRPYEGNPAAVVVLSCRQFDAPGVENWMQQVAMERNLSETAYVAPLSEAHVGQNEYRLRWFTPGCEIPLCGHATLAAAFTLFEDGHCDNKECIRFHTLSGLLTTRYVVQADGRVEIEMDFPALRKQDHDEAWLLETFSTLAHALQIEKYDILAVVEYGTKVLCHVRPPAYSAVQPDFAALATLPCQSVVLTCQAPAASGYDFYSRVFGPKVGVNEDPVTGSAHCALAPYWHAHLPTHPRHFRARQTSRRGGDLGVRLTDDNRVFLTGSAVMTLRGKMLQ
ncbi:hypothetical protein SPRG_04677 [Saprolegnia parasitica CBS 223.65]|uniref:N-acetyltransferase domain-containing protein n=1 Tax=Saprolegnia parasitica (strain CBS 223.65) TaxID=695850 RepID=A0A067CW87_SAPPC|nr:hypothetical protein SPRG_04677 [Saprolegnia parasitica CBS 223.65]KDO30776.1 hypothetical protein SPRG_04677 [Saprolegnia parasitica CBS 223.65]|eukprot:XP_012198474.1 hypothetical protein SPRG_04677 [Saprolegnia parasitica CBS 223.65]